MTRLMLAAALAATSSLVPLSLHADDLSARDLGAIPVRFDSLPSDAPVLSVMVTGDLAGKAPRHRPSSGRVTGIRQVVMIDGSLMAIDERFLRDQIAAGAMTVVFPGTKSPWSEGALPPDYPPAWFLEQPVVPATGG
jgi:hypothetical protein